jgi:hypothetical protein
MAQMNAEELRARVVYEPLTGEFRRLTPSMGRAAGGCVGYTDPRGYLLLRVKGLRFYAHRLAWLYEKGEWPQHDIDHINGDKSDNRIANLRDVEPRVNLENQRRSRGKTSRFLGVSWNSEKRRWKAAIQVRGRVKNLGHFDDEKMAYQAYVQAKRVFHEGCTL